MWEEDEHWQKGNYRLLLWGVGCASAAVMGYSAWMGDWDLARQLLTGLGIVLAALCLYAVGIRLMGRGFLLLLRLYRRLRR